MTTKQNALGARQRRLYALILPLFEKEGLITRKSGFSPLHDQFMKVCERIESGELAIIVKEIE